MTYTSFIDALLAENVSSKPTYPYNQPPLKVVFEKCIKYNQFYVVKCRKLSSGGNRACRFLS